MGRPIVKTFYLPRRLRAMPWVLVVLAIASLPVVTQAQNTLANDARVINNPVLRALWRISPSDLPAVLVRLPPLTGGSAPGGVRGPQDSQSGTPSDLAKPPPVTGSGAPDGIRNNGDKPTAPEMAEIAENPDFAAAFNNAPDETLKLLRWINRHLKSGGD